MDVVWEESVEGFSEGPDYVEGRMEDAHGPASGGLDKVCEELQSNVCGETSPQGDGCAAWERGDCGKTRNRAEGAVFSRGCRALTMGIVQTEM